MFRRRLEPYVLKEILGPLGLGFLVYTFILLTDFVYKSAEMIIRRGVPSGQVGKLVLYTLPNIVVLTIPMALLFGILVAIGRLSSDHELVAMRASGVSLFRLYRPSLFIAAVLTVLNTALMVDLLPRGNSALTQLRLDILTGSVERQVEPRVFYEEWEGLVLYVSEVSPVDGKWRGVFLAESLPAQENQVTVAERGEVQLDESNDKLVLRLENAVTHKVDFRNPIKYQRSRYRTIERVVDEDFSGPPVPRGTSSKGLRELTLGELQEKLRDPNLPEQLAHLAHVEIHKKFSIPVACVVFGLLALPLGFSNLRGGRSSGFVLSIAVVMVYWILINNGEEAAAIGQIPPWLAMWLPNILLAAVALLLMWRKNRDRTLLPSMIDRWLRRHLRPTWATRGRRRPGAAPGPAAGALEAAARPDFVVRLPRLRLRFPNLIDRYVIRVFSGVFAMVMLSGVVIYVVADLSQKADFVLRNEVPLRVVVDYYKYFVMQICYETAPITVLVTTLIAFGLLSRSNELVAAKALGISLYRFALPAVAVALGVVAVSALLQLTILPTTNERVLQLKDQIKGRETVRSYRRADRQWLFGHGRYVYNYLNYDPDSQTLHRLQVFELDEEFRLRRRLFAATATYQGDAWLFNDSWVRTFDGTDMTFRSFPEPVLDAYPETPDYFEEEVKPPEAMTYAELKNYVREIEGSGQSAPELKVALFRKVAHPFVSLVMALVALPFSFRLGRRGALYGIGVGVALGMVFFGLHAVFTTLGETGALPAAVAAWSPSGIFSLASAYLFLGVKS